MPPGVCSFLPPLQSCLCLAGVTIQPLFLLGASAFLASTPFLLLSLLAQAHSTGPGFWAPGLVLPITALTLGSLALTLLCPRLLSALTLSLHCFGHWVPWPCLYPSLCTGLSSPTSTLLWARIFSPLDSPNSNHRF